MKLALPILTVAAVASALPQTASTPPPSFKITNVVSGGTGCPQGSIDVNWTDDKVLPICESLSPLRQPSSHIKIRHMTIVTFGFANTHLSHSHHFSSLTDSLQTSERSLSLL